MDLKDKLKYYQSDKKQIPEDKENHLEDMTLHFEGKILEAETLPILKITKKIPCHYIYPSAEDCNQSSIHIPLLTKKQFPDPVDLNDILIFDLETTGLAGGTGTYPFLIGLGEFQETYVRIHQYFLPDFGREISAYLDMEKLWQRKNILLSYNGKSFDYPLLRNRFILNRIDNPFETYTHLDLLHPTRRLWKNRLPSCSLETVEQYIFSFSRWRDIEGSLIPQAYFTFLQTGDFRDIERIIDHNQQDILSLARLLFHMHDLENSEIGSKYSEREWISMFNIAVTISDLDKIEPMMNSLVKEDKILPVRSLKNYSLLLKRQHKWDQALKIWQNFIDQGEEILFSCEEFAKYFEHRERNIKSALEYTNRAIEYLTIMEDIGELVDPEEFRERFNRRLNRLQYKLRQE
jgi:uncharacterized protein YprB with RNaseH-like and TPR domain